MRAILANRNRGVGWSQAPATADTEADDPRCYAAPGREPVSERPSALTREAGSLAPATALGKVNCLPESVWPGASPGARSLRSPRDRSQAGGEVSMSRAAREPRGQLQGRGQDRRGGRAGDVEEPPAGPEAFQAPLAPLGCARGGRRAAGK